MCCPGYVIRAGEYYDCTIFLHLISHRRIDMEITARTDLIVRVWDCQLESTEFRKKEKTQREKNKRPVDGWIIVIFAISRLSTVSYNPFLFIFFPLSLISP